MRSTVMLQRVISRVSEVLKIVFPDVKRIDALVTARGAMRMLHWHKTPVLSLMRYVGRLGSCVRNFLFVPCAADIVACKKYRVVCHEYR